MFGDLPASQSRWSRLSLVLGIQIQTVSTLVVRPCETQISSSGTIGHNPRRGISQRRLCRIPFLLFLKENERHDRPAQSPHLACRSNSTGRQNRYNRNRWTPTGVPAIAPLFRGPDSNMLRQQPGS